MPVLLAELESHNASRLAVASASPKCFGGPAALGKQPREARVVEPGV